MMNLKNIFSEKSEKSDKLLIIALYNNDMIRKAIIQSIIRRRHYG